VRMKYAEQKMTEPREMKQDPGSDTMLDDTSSVSSIIKLI
jgi:hypothetical protein